MGLLDGLRGRPRQPRAVLAAPGPVVPIEIVGEAAHQQHIGALLARYGDGEFTIGLRGQPDNPYDSNAVVIYADGAVVGYLPRDLAAQWQAPVMAAEANGLTVMGRAQVFGGNPGAPSLGVFGSATWPGEGKPLDRYHRG